MRSKEKPDWDERYRWVCLAVTASIPEAAAVIAAGIFLGIGSVMFCLWYSIRLAAVGRPAGADHDPNNVMPVVIMLLACLLEGFFSGWAAKLSVLGVGLAIFLMVPPLLAWRRLWRRKKWAAAGRQLTRYGGPFLLIREDLRQLGKPPLQRAIVIVPENLPLPSRFAGKKRGWLIQ